MNSKLNPYLTFQGNARQAMEFYHRVLGGELKMSTFKEFNASRDPSDDNKIMHAELETGDGMTLMGSDTASGMDFNPGSNISLSLSGENQAQLQSYFDKLSAGGRVTMPLEKALWGDWFGMFTDQFGINWMVNIAGQRG